MRLVCVLTPCLFLSFPSLAQGGAPLETELEAEAVVVVTPVADDDSAFDAEPFLGELSLLGQSEKVFENGVRVRARGALRLQSDHPNRPGGIGGFGSVAAAPVGAFSGLSSADCSGKSRV